MTKLVLNLVIFISFFGSLVWSEENCESSPNSFDMSEYFESLQEKVAKIKSKCGQVCQFNTYSDLDMETTSEYPKKEVNCKELFQIELLKPLRVPPIPPKKIPKSLRQDFQRNSSISFEPAYYMHDMQQSGGEIKWEAKTIDRVVEDFKRGKLNHGAYKLHDRKNIMRHLKEKCNVEGSRALVIGSQTPWIEAMLISLGAESVTTLEYAPIECNHPKVTTITPVEMAEAFLADKLPKFDLMVTFSSLEHSGLGRYGDELNPFGDLIEMQRARCILKDNGGRALVGVPTCRQGRLLYNACRLYGPVDFANLFANWKFVYSEIDYRKYSDDCPWCYQPLFVIEK